MKTFSELQEGDKIYIYASKPFKRDHELANSYYYPNEFIPGVYTINEITKIGFCYNFEVSTIIGSSVKFSYKSEGISINIIHPNTCISRTLCRWVNPSYQHQKIFITTSEEEWLKKINENV